MSTRLGEDLHKRLVRPMLLSILAAVVIYAGAMIISDLNAARGLMSSLGFDGWLLVLGLSLANYGLRFVRWEIYLRSLNSRVPILHSLAYYLAGFAFTTTPAKSGEAVRSIYLKRHGMTYVHSLAALFSERLVDLVAMVLLALLAALAFPGYQWTVLAVTLLVTALVPLIHARPMYAFLDRQSTRLPHGRLRTAGSRLLELLRSSSTLLRSAPLYAGVILALLAWGAEGVALHVILQKLEVDTSLGLAVGIYSVSILAGALSAIAGGLGSTEAVMILLLTLTDVDMPTAVAATVICRLATLWFAVVIGSVALAVLEVNSKTARERATGVQGG